MLASILNRERAIAVNIQVIRVYNKMRKFLGDQEILAKREDIKQRTLLKRKLDFEVQKQL